MNKIQEVMEKGVLPYKDERMVAFGNTGRSKKRVTATCTCGEEFDVRLDSLVSGHTKSCGCLQRARVSSAITTHGMTDTPTYKSWVAMKTRCTNPASNVYEQYGGRGIKVCNRWDKFENFLEDMGERLENESIDRVNNNGNYCKENCRWSTISVQNRNKRSNVTYKGECATDASIRLGGERNLVRGRLASGWPAEKAFNKPLRATKDIETLINKAIKN